MSHFYKLTHMLQNWRIWCREKKKKKVEGGFVHITVTGEKGGFVP